MLAEAQTRMDVMERWEALRSWFLGPLQPAMPLEEQFLIAHQRGVCPELRVSVVPEDWDGTLSLEELAALQREILSRAGYDPETGRLACLEELGIAHFVTSSESIGVWNGVEPNFILTLPGASLDQCRRIAAFLGDAFDQAAVGVWLFEAETPNVRGLALRKRDGRRFAFPDVEQLGHILHRGGNIAFQLSADQERVEFWDHARQTTDFADAVATGLAQAGYELEDVDPVTAASFLVLREEYSTHLVLESSASQEQLRQVHAEVFGRIPQSPRQTLP